MKTKYIITDADLDNLDEFEQADIMATFTSETKARAEFASWLDGRTNMHIKLIRVELVDNGQGRLR